MMNEKYPAGPMRPGFKPMTNEGLANLMQGIIFRLLTNENRFLEKVPELSPVLHVWCTHTGPDHLRVTNPHSLKGLAHPKHIEAVYAFVRRLEDELFEALSTGNESLQLQRFLAMANYTPIPSYVEDAITKNGDITRHLRITEAILHEVHRELKRYVEDHHHDHH